MCDEWLLVLRHQLQYHVDRGVMRDVCVMNGVDEGGMCVCLYDMLMRVMNGCLF